MSRDLFSDKNSGYKLKTLQLLNWGVFDKKTVTFCFNAASTILTGLNGSGKTTTVDAILTLLVPSSLRYYNLSSDSIKKRERDVENYILGAYGANLESSGEGTSKCLRKKDEVLSILSGIFFDESKESYISLMQVRYFSSGDLKTAYIISSRELRIEEIKENNIDIRPGNRWKQEIEKLGALVTDSPTQYTNQIIDKFGLKSQVALKLFSQTVGMKVLGDVTTFIRQYMLEDKSPVKEFNELKQNFRELKSIDNKIAKTEIEIRELDKVLAVGDEYIKAKKALQNSINEKNAEEMWYMTHAKAKGEEEITANESKIAMLNAKTDENNAAQKAAQERLYTLKHNENAIAIESLKREIKEKEERAILVNERLTSYKESIDKIKAIGADIEDAKNEAEFINNQQLIPSFRSNVEHYKAIAEEEKEKLNRYILAERDELNDAEKELIYLESKNTNIPKCYDAIREAIANELRIKAKDLYFGGELLMLKAGEEEWERAAENALEPLSLSLIIKPEYKDRVNTFLDENKLGSNIIRVIAAESTINSYKAPKSELLNGKLEIKETEYKDFLGEYLSAHFDYKCVESLDSFNKENKAILKSGLFKDSDNETKDEREDLYSSYSHYLGWNNEKKKEELREKIDALKSEIEDFMRKRDKFKKRIEDAIKAINALDSLSKFKSWSEIDLVGIKREIESLKEKLNTLLASNLDLKRIEEEIKELEIKIKTYDELIKKDLKEIVILESSITSIKKVLEALKKDEERPVAPAIVEEFVKRHKSAISYNTFEELLERHNVLEVSLKERIAKESDEVNTKKAQTEKAMGSFLAPSKNVIEPENSWIDEVSGILTDEADYIDDYKKLYKELTEDNLISAKEEFNNFLKTSLSNVLGTLSEQLNRWDKEIDENIRVLNRNLRLIPFDKEKQTYIELEKLSSGDKDHSEFNKALTKAIPDKLVLINSTEEEKLKLFKAIDAFLDKYSDDKLRKSVLDLRGKYKFIIKENNIDGDTVTYYKDTAALSGGEKAKLTYTILAAALAYQYNLDSDEDGKGPFRFVILDEAFSKSDAINSEYALKLFKELDLQLMVITPRNGINIVEGYVSSLHLIEKLDDNTSRVKSMTIEEYRDAE